MRTCPRCHRLFADRAARCAVDGAPLVRVKDAAAPSDELDPRVGTRVAGGRYRLFRRLGDGGTASVFEAHDEAEDRRVAVKILHPEATGDRESLQRFWREYTISSLVTNEHLVEVLAFELLDGGSCAVIMEHLDGTDLRAVLRREGRLVPGRVVRLVAQVALGLAGAHALRLVHRDLKPENVFLCPGSPVERVKVLDFGSARDNRTGAAKLTETGTTLGSPHYMSPEQVQGSRALDHRSDVWSLAVIAFECLTATRPFSGRNPVATLTSIVLEPHPPPSSAAPDLRLPRAVDGVFSLALAKDPDGRLASLAELARRLASAFGFAGDVETLARARDEELVAEPAPSTRRGKRAPPPG